MGLETTSTNPSGIYPIGKKVPPLYCTKAITTKKAIIKLQTVIIVIYFKIFIDFSISFLRDAQAFYFSSHNIFY